MRKLHAAAAALFAAMLVLGASQAWSQDKAAPCDVDGAIWMKSGSDEKRAFLFGAGNAIVLEYFIRTKHGEKPSRFVQGWVDVFPGKTWGDLEKSLDEYYRDHPDRMDESVFQVIWKYMIEPYEKK